MSGRKYYGPWSAQPVGSLADISLHTQNGSVGPIGLTGGHVAKGLYRVSACITVQTGATAGQSTVEITCTGENGFNSYNLPTIDLTQAFSQSADFVVSADGTSDITYAAICDGLTAGSLAYSLRVVLEQLTNQA